MADNAGTAKTKRPLTAAELAAHDPVLRSIEDEIRALKRKKRARHGELRGKARTLENRKKVLAGAAVLSEAAGHPEYRAALFKLLDRFLQRPDERELFGFAPLPGTVPEATPAQASATEANTSEFPAVAAHGFEDARRAVRH